MVIALTFGAMALAFQVLDRSSSPSDDLLKPALGEAFTVVDSFEWSDMGRTNAENPTRSVILEAKHWKNASAARTKLLEQLASAGWRVSDSGALDSDRSTCLSLYTKESWGHAPVPEAVGAHVNRVLDSSQSEQTLVANLFAC